MSMFRCRRWSWLVLLGCLAVAAPLAGQQRGEAASAPRGASALEASQAKLRRGDEQEQLAAVAAMRGAGQDAPSGQPAKVAAALAYGLGSSHKSVVVAATTALLAPALQPHGAERVRQRLVELRGSLTSPPPAMPSPSLPDVRAELPPDPPPVGSSKKRWREYEAAYKAWEKGAAARERASQQRKAKWDADLAAWKRALDARAAAIAVFGGMVGALGEVPADAFVDELLPVLPVMLRESPTEASRLVTALVRSGRRDAVVPCAAVLASPEQAFGALGGVAWSWYALVEGGVEGPKFGLAELRAMMPGVDDATLVRTAMLSSEAGAVMQRTAAELRRLGDEVGVPAPARGRRERTAMESEWRQWSERVAGKLRTRGVAGR